MIVEVYWYKVQQSITETKYGPHSLYTIPLIKKQIDDDENKEEGREEEGRKRARKERKKEKFPRWEKRRNKVAGTRAEPLLVS